MNDVFTYGGVAEGENFTDREDETRRLVANFEHGVNTLLVSNRRIGKTSLVRRVRELVDGGKVAVVYLDVFDCRSEYDFYNKLASAVLRQTATKAEALLQNVRSFLGSVSPKITLSPDPTTEFAVSLGLAPRECPPERVLDLAERIAKKLKKRIVVCIDEFQQVGEFPDSLQVQKRLRGAWQLQQHVSYCLFGSRKHLMTEMFQNRSMPFYQFGDAVFLDAIPAEKWIPFIRGKFRKQKMSISEEVAGRICEAVRCHSSYVQQLSWLVMLRTDREATAETVERAVEELVEQNSALFMQQTVGLTSTQMNLLRAIANDLHDGLQSKKVLEEYNLGTRANVGRIRKALVDRDLVEIRENGLYFCDPVFGLWFRSRCM